MNNEFELQNFYLVSIDSCNGTSMKKVFLQKKQAIKYGRKLATQNNNINYDICLWKQPMTNSGTIEFVCYLEPFSE